MGKNQEAVERENKEVAASKVTAGRLGSAVTFGLLFILGFVILPFFVFGKIVPPNYIGVRQNYYTVPGLFEKGFSNLGLTPGLQWKIPGLSTIILLPRDFQFVHFNNENLGGNLDLSELEVPTTDGSKVKTDVTLVVRLYEEPEKVAESPASAATLPVSQEALDEGTDVPFVHPLAQTHGGPKDLVLTYAAAPERQLQTFARIAENELKKNLSELSTTDYYNPAKRERAALVAGVGVNKVINPGGMELWATLIRRYVYAEKNIDDQIFAKNLQDQTERLNASSSRLALAKSETERQRALWDAKIRDLEVDREAKIRILDSEGDLYQAKKTAEADLMVAQAKAAVDSARASVLAESVGADVYVARELAPLLRTLTGGVVSGIDPYNLSQWVQKLTSTAKE